MLCAPPRSGSLLALQLLIPLTFSNLHPHAIHISSNPPNDSLHIKLNSFTHNSCEGSFQSRRANDLGWLILLWIFQPLCSIWEKLTTNSKLVYGIEEKNGCNLKTLAKIYEISI